MKTLFESILDDVVVGGSMDMPKVKDYYNLTNITIENTDWSKLRITDYINYRALRSYCVKQGYKLNSKWIPGAMELAAIFNEVPVLGYEQNFVAELRKFVKPGSEVILNEVTKINEYNRHVCMTIKAPATKELPDIEVNVYLHKRKD